MRNSSDSNVIKLIMTIDGDWMKEIKQSENMRRFRVEMVAMKAADMLRIYFIA